jgi:hypothetical protein
MVKITASMAIEEIGRLKKIVKSRQCEILNALSELQIKEKMLLMKRDEIRHRMKQMKLDRSSPEYEYYPTGIVNDSDKEEEDQKSTYQRDSIFYF